MYLRLLLLLLIGHATTAGAQDDADVADLPKSLVVPTEQSISIKLTSRDTTMFVYYNLYAFEYADKFAPRERVDKYDYEDRDGRYHESEA